MDIYEALNHISKLAFPKIKYTWENWSINGEKPIFQISIVSNKIEDYIEDYYEKGLGAILRVIESNSLSSEEEYYAKQLLVVLADHAINYHSDICKNKPEIACKLYKKKAIFRETVIEYAPHLCKLVSNLLASSFFHLEFKTVKDICDNCISKYTIGTELHRQLLERLRDEFTYNHSFSDLVTEDNTKKYWEIAEYINQSVLELNFYQVRDGQTIFEIQQDIEGLKALKPLIKLVEKERYWTDIKSIPEFIEFEYVFPNGFNGDIIKYTLEEYGETYVVAANKWYGKISKKHLELLEMFAVQASHITEDTRLLNLYAEHHTPTILSGRLWERNTTKSYRFRLFVSTQQLLYEYRHDRKNKCRELYAQLVKEGQASPKWKSEAQLYTLTASLYPDAIYQYHPKWLGMQSLDIFIPSLSVGIEYQGKQHYKPIEHFGGERHFLHQQANDRKKKELCVENGVILIEWPYTEDITESNLRKHLVDAIGE